MRALCGAIIAAGAFIGLGLTALGYGIRYSPLSAPYTNAQGQVVTGNTSGAQSGTDTPLVYCIVLETIVGVVGLGIAFLGLMYHHYKRHHEFIRDHGRPPHTEAFPFIRPGG